VRAAGNGSNGRANSLHSIKGAAGAAMAGAGQADDGGGGDVVPAAAVEDAAAVAAVAAAATSQNVQHFYFNALPALAPLLTRPRELYEALRRHWDDFTYARRDYSLWIFKPADK